MKHNLARALEHMDSAWQLLSEALGFDPPLQLVHNNTQEGGKQAESLHIDETLTAELARQLHQMYPNDFCCFSRHAHPNNHH